jgi:hypothetical protein
MADRTDPEVTQGLADSPQAPAPQEADTPSAGEISAPMLDVHAPHQLVHTWKDFFIHIATIVIGLFIAVGLEQTVEVFHHRHLREQLELQMHDVLASDLQLDARSLQQLSDLRAYLLQMRAAVIARLDGKSDPGTLPATDDPRTATFIGFPSLAPYDAAKENGSVAYLPSTRIRIFNRIALQRELIAAVREHWFDGLAALSQFDERYTDFTGSLELRGVATAPDLAKLSRAELTEYLSVVAALIKKTDLLADRLRLFDSECQALLDGVQDEDALIRAITLGSPKDSISKDPAPSQNQ